MNQERIIRNARLVTREESFLGVMRTRGGIIESVDHDDTAVATSEDWEGDWLLPGLVELHTDNLEKHFAPRPGVSWPILPAVLAHDAQIAAAGITTVLDALALGDVKPGGARTEQLQPMLDAIAVARAHHILRAEHLLHLRCEISSPNIIEQFESLAGDLSLRLVSVMDHTPGQRQFISLDKYREYYQGKYALSDSEMSAFTATQIKAHHEYSATNRDAVIELCRTRGITLASHDDATPEHVEQAAARGISISEFPTSLAAARAANSHGLGVVMGAPNVVRGKSHSGNISALDLAQARVLDGLSSDYVPASLLHAAFLLRDCAGWGISQAIACVSGNPARMVGLCDRGELAPGLHADFLRVRENSGVPIVISAWREGHRIA